MADITVRPARPADVAAMSALMIASITELCSGDHRNDPQIVAAWTANKEPRTVRQWLDNPDMAVLVAEHQGEIAAVGAFRPDGEITLNYVSPDHRFMGVSRTLLSDMERRISEAGIAMARLASTVTARRFYRDAGWQDDGVTDVKFSLVTYPMHKRLSS